MLKPYLSLTLASTLMLASCNLTAPNTSNQVGGIGQNPCLDNHWQSSDYCKGVATVAQSQVTFVASHTLQLEPIPLQLQRSGLPLALVANALSSQNLPQGAQVEFFLNGQSLGKVDASALNTQTHTFLELLKNLKPGQYNANAVLLNANGQKLADSNTITFNIPEAVNPNTPAIALLGPTTQQPLQAGTPLKAVAVAYIPSNQPNTTLAFLFNGQTVNATPNPDGTYSFDIDTTGLAPGTYPIDAVLKDATGKIISRSAIKNIIIAPAPQANQPQLQLFNLSGVSTTPQGNPLNLSGLLNLPDNLKKTGQTIVFFANGQQIAEGTVDRNGHYALTWQTRRFATGDYTLTAKVFNSDGSLVIESNPLPITLTGAEVAVPAVQLNSLPAQAFPGSNISLTATPNIPSNLDPNALTVVFTANGQVLGNGTRNPDGSYTLPWNTSGLAQQSYDIKAELKDASGQTLATSNIGKITLTEDTPVNIQLTSGNVSTTPGTRVSLTSTIQVPTELSNGGAYVEFRQGTTVIGRGTRQTDGTYLVNFDTTGYAPGDYPVEAVLKSASGQQLAVSNRSIVKLAGVPQHQIILTSTSIESSVGNSVPLTANVTLAQTTINTQAAAVRFFSNGELLGIGIKQPDGTYRLDWDTNGRTIGQYPIQAILVDANGQALAESLMGVVNLQSAQSNTISLVNPTQGNVFSFGSNTPLEAAIAITQAQRDAGVAVEFFIDGNKRITAIDSGSGKYTATLNQPAVGDHTVRAILKTLGGTVLAESNVHTFRVSSSAVAGGGGGGGSNSGSSSGSSGGGNGNIGTVNPPTNVNRTLDLVRPTDGGGLSLNTPTELQASATLNPQDVADGYKIRFRDPASNFSQDVVPTRPNLNTTSYTASAILTPTGPLGNRPIIAEIVDINGNVVSTLTDTHTLNVVDTTVNLLTPADNSVVAPNSNQTLSGEATNVPANGTVRFVVKSSTGNILATLAATNTSGNTWATATGAWNTPGTLQDVDIDMQVLPPGTENPLVVDTHDVAVVTNAVNTTGPVNNSTLTPGAFSNNVLLTSSVPVLTAEQITNGATIFFDVLDNGGNPVNGLSNLVGTQQTDNTWQANADLSAMNTGNYSVRAKILATSNPASSVLFSDDTPNAFTLATPTVTLQTPADNSVVAPSAAVTLSGEATNVPTGGIVRFVVKDSGGNTLATLAATNTTGNTWASATNAWTAPLSAQEVTVDMQVLPSGSSTPAASDSHTAFVVGITLNQPTDNTQVVIGSTPALALQSTTSHVPTGSNVRFIVTDSTGSEVLNEAATEAGNQDYTGSWSIANLPLGVYTLTTVVRNGQNQTVVSDAHTVKLIQNTTSTLSLPTNSSNPGAGTLHFKDADPVTFSYTPQDSNNNPLSTAQMTGIQVQFVDVTNQTTLGTGTRQSDGSYTADLDLSTASSGSRQVVAQLVDTEVNAPLANSPEKPLLLENFSDVVYGVDNAGAKRLYVINKITGALFSLGDMIDGGNALGKYPNQGAEKGFVYYIEGSNGNDLRKWNPSSGTIVEENISTSSSSYSRFGMGIVNGSVVAFASNGANVYRIDLATKVRTEIYRTGTTNSPLLTQSDNSGDLAFAPDGTLYIAQGKNVLRIAFADSTNATNATHGSIVSTLTVDAMQANFSSFGFVGANEALGVENRGNTNNQLIRLNGNFATATQGSELTYATVGSPYNFVVGDITSSH